MPPAPACPECRAPLPPNAPGWACPACEAALPAPARAKAPVGAVHDAEGDDRPRKPGKAPPRRPTNRYRKPLLFALGLYIPFLGGVIVVGGAVAAVLVSRGLDREARAADGAANVVSTLQTAAGVMIGLAVAHLLLGTFALFRRTKDKDELEFELPDVWQEELVDLIDRVADARGLDRPDAVRMHAASVAHVYQDRNRRSILAVGGLAVAALPQRALAGVIAHELAHFTAGDTAVSAMARRWHDVMVRLDVLFLSRQWVRWNPLAWVFRGYHHLYARLWFAYMRACEYEADYHEALQVGTDAAAGTLVLMTVLGEMEFATLGAVAEGVVEMNQKLDRIFAEQVRRVRGATASEWFDAMRKALRRPPHWADTHPSLEDRLGFLGVKPKKALRLAADLDGEPATALFANWPVVEKFLTKTILAIARENYRAWQEVEDVLDALSRVGGPLVD